MTTNIEIEVDLDTLFAAIRDIDPDVKEIVEELELDIDDIGVKWLDDQGALSLYEKLDEPILEEIVRLYHEHVEAEKPKELDNEALLKELASRRTDADFIRLAVRTLFDL
jgi:hypothetical protein